MFSQLIQALDIPSQYDQLGAITDDHVTHTLQKPTWGPSDFNTFISPAAVPHLEQMAQLANRLTIQRFGRTMQLFIPLYVSNLCYNKCTYCGFSVTNKYKRVVLSDAQIIAEATTLKSRGFDHILLLTGEAEDKVGVQYIANAIRLIRPLFASIGIEVQPMSKPDYDTLMDAGADSLTLFQETYHPAAYATYHLAGKKRHYANRLNAVESGAAAGFYRITLGALLGLTHWRYDAIALAQHVAYLQKRYWKTKYAISFPRIREMVNAFSVAHPVSDRDIVQFILAFRLCFPDLGITLSTRESAAFRDHLVPLGITQMSAESNTAPGGYCGTDTEPQFEISDHRTLSEVCDMLTQQRYEPVLRDWV